MRHLLNGSFGLAADNGPHPWILLLKGIIMLVSHMSRPLVIDKQQQ
jgi:hypothetical protein